MIVRFKGRTTFEGKDYAAGDEATLSYAAVEALGDSVEEVTGRHQLGEKPLNHKAQAEVNRKADAEARTDKAVGDSTPGLSTKDLNGAPKDTQVENAPAKK